jgi:hypothetical protein
MRRPRLTYPPTWKVFSRAIRFERALGQCECCGECGLHRTHPGPRRCVERDQQPAQWARGRVVLTVAHLCSCDPPCVEAAHVKAMCNRCHLRTDGVLHSQHRAETRRLQREAAGQLTFLGAGTLKSWLFVPLLLVALAAPSQATCPVIPRSQAVLRAFQRLHPCPSTGKTTGKCPGYIRDHVDALACGGKDAVENLQWQTYADALAKDKWELKGCPRCRHLDREVR